ncbi:MAG: efflux RND transporter periplasmic adaptor subunit [Bdellovibrionaceae bacterium]|nr:efflux RND transporter periplasmic adaptor subunit [Pseudobdellovibrionaceae bacterium]
MKNKILIFAVIFALLIGLGLWWTQKQRSSHNHTHHHTSAEHEKYICPMHPHITSNTMSTCPICGMDLVLASEMDEDEDYEGESEGEQNTQVKPHTPQGRAPVRLSLDKQQMIGVKVEKAQKKNLFKSIKAPGRIAFDPELYTAQSEYLEALKQWKRVQNSPLAEVKSNTQQMINSSKIRLRVLGLSEEHINALTRRGSQSESLLVGGQDNIVYADIFEIDLPYIKVGQATQITAGFLQEKFLPGKVTSVDRVINPETRTAKVRIELLKSDPAIRPESYVNVTILAPLGEHLSVPLESILDTGVDAFVFVKKGEGRFEPKKVQVLLETSTDAALVGDIKEGDLVVVGAQFLMDSESRLRSVIQDGSSPSQEHDH